MIKNLFGYGKHITMLIALIIGWSLTFDTAYGEDISSSELVNNAKKYDGKIVRYKGEVIGDIMKRGDSAWINVNDGQNAIGIYAENSLIKDITYGGSYRFKGDVVELSGIFHRACLLHGGDLDIHAQGQIRKITSGRQVFDSVNFNKIKTALILLAILLLLWGWDLFQQNNSVIK